MTTDNGAFGFDDPIEREYLVPEGPATFEVTDFRRERGEFGQMGVCNIAALELQVTGSDGVTSSLDEKLPLHRKMQWKLFAFFTAIGQRKHGDGPMVPDWSKVKGAKGKCTIKHRQGNNRTFAGVGEYIDPDAKPETATATGGGKKAFSF